GADGHTAVYNGSNSYADSGTFDQDMSAATIEGVYYVNGSSSMGHLIGIQSTSSGGQDFYGTANRWGVVYGDGCTGPGGSDSTLCLHYTPSGGGDQRWACHFTPTQNSWYHFVFTYDGSGTVNCYINGTFATGITGYGSGGFNMSGTTAFVRAGVWN